VRASPHRFLLPFFITVVSPGFMRPAHAQTLAAKPIIFADPVPGRLPIVAP
jgi:hypothetical protein